MFDRNNIEVHTVQVVTVSTPHMDKYNNQFDMVVDVAVLDAGKTQTYTFKDSNEVGYTGQLMITPNKECVIEDEFNQKIYQLATNWLNDKDSPFGNSKTWYYFN